MTKKKDKKENKVLLKRFLITLFFLITCLFVSVIIGIFVFKPYQKSSIPSYYCKDIDSCKTCLLSPKKNDSLNFTSEDIKLHNQELLSTLLERETSESSKWASRQNSIDQLHAIYIGFLAIILSIILKGKTKKKLPYYLILLFLIIMGMWWLDIHQQDLNYRSDYMFHNTGHTVVKFVNLDPTDATWYTLDYRAVNDSLCQLENKAFVRKLQKFVKPSMEQIIFYISPLVLLYIYIIMIINIKKKYF